MIGYGTDLFGQKYWLCANSWGIKWGEEGYFKIAQDDYDSGMDVGLMCTPDLDSPKLEKFLYQ